MSAFPKGLKLCSMEAERHFGFYSFLLNASTEKHLLETKC